MDPRVSEPACFWAAPAPGICYPALAPAPGKREHNLEKILKLCQLFFLMRLRIQQLKKCGSGSSLTKFVTNHFMKCWKLEIDKKKVAKKL